jgi:hypothetical protein
MRKLLALTATAALLVVGAGCNSGSDDIYPMSVGSVWHLRLSLVAGTTLASLDTVQTGTTTTTAVEKANLTAGGEVVKFMSESSVHITDPDTTITSTGYAYYRESGDYILGYSTLDDTTADTVMVTTPSVGQTWNQGGSMTAEVIGREDVTVAAGTYKNAWKVKLTSSGSMTFDAYCWYAKGVGMVKYHYEYSIQNYTQIYNQELTSATIK